MGKGQRKNAASKVYAQANVGEAISTKAQGINKVEKILEGGNLPLENQSVLWPYLIMKLHPLKIDSGNLLIYSWKDFTINFGVFPIRSQINF